MKKQNPIPHSTALRLVLENVPVVSAERIKLAMAAGRAIRDTVLADRQLPPFNRSAMDGYAVRSADFKNGVASLRCVGTLEAGRIWKGRLKKGEALKIMTGAPVPEGADMVVMVERSSATGNMVELREPSAARRLNIHRKGSDAREGEVLIGEGERFNALRVSVAASAGCVNPLVARKIRVSVISTGDEVIAPDKKPKPFQIRDANSAHLMARLSCIDLVAASFGGLVPDDPAAFKKTFKRAIASSDMVLISGGVSMGDSDFTFKTLATLGVKQIFHKSAIRPGKPVWFGIKGKAVVFGLPGNPVSVAVTFHEFVLPAIRKMAGLNNPAPRKLLLPLAGDVIKKNRLKEFLPARVTEDGMSVEPVKSYKGSGDFVSASKSDGVIVLPEKAETLKAGRVVEFHPWEM